jgi:RimJ/RimL family protein N-acetyltransferase
MINLIKFRKADSSKIENWLQDDKIGMEFLSTYAKTDDYIDLIDFSKRYLWIINDDKDNSDIGFFDFEFESSEVGYIVFYIEPNHRGQGLGLEILNKALILSELRQCKKIEAGVENNNTASIKTLERAGFNYSYTDEDGMLMYDRLIQ